MQNWAAQRQAQRTAAEQAATRLRTPVAQQVEGMGLQERAQRLRSQFRLLSAQEVGRRSARDPAQVGLQHRVVASEQMQERERHQALRQERHQGRGRPGVLGQVAGAGLAAAAGPPGWAVAFAVGLPLAGKKLLDAIEGITTGILERQRKFARYSPQIATAFAKVERQERFMGAQMGRETGGSTAMLANSLMDFKRAMYPLRRDITTMVHYLAMVALKGGEMASLIAQIWPEVQAGSAVLAWMRAKQRESAPPIGQFLKDIAAGNLGPAWAAEEHRKRQKAGGAGATGEW